MTKVSKVLKTVSAVRKHTINTASIILWDTTRLSCQKKEDMLIWGYFCFIDYAKTLTAWITINCGKFFTRWEYQTT